MAMATMEITIDSADRPRKMFATDARISTITPANSHLPMAEKSRFDTVAIVAITARMVAVPPNAVMISMPPFE